jgi:glycosyltransferase involved in cell wall biosynthesis
VIVYLHGAQLFGAVEHYVASVAAGARAAGHEVLLVYPDAAENAPFEALADVGIRREAFPAELLTGRAPRLARHLAATVRRERPCIVHATDVWPVAQVAARVAGAHRVLVTHHTPELPRHDGVIGRAWWALGWLARPEIIYTSEADRKGDGRRLFRTHVIPLGFDVVHFAEGREARAPESARIGVIARLSEQKGHRYLIDAAPHVLRERPDAVFVFIGDGEQRATLERLVAERELSGHFRFVGERADVVSDLDGLDVVAHPALFEGLCLAVIEAQAAGVPVVATAVGGIPENVIDGVTGLLVQPRDARGLADAIGRLLRSPEEARAMAARAQQRVLERYSEEAMVERTVALYGESTLAGST